MTQNSDRQKLNTNQIEQHLKSAVDTLTPNVLDRIDLSTPQDVVDPVVLRSHSDNMIVLQRRMRRFVIAAAACLCLVLTGGGTYHYQYLNRQIDSVIGIDVNPSVELSINRKNRVLSATALNADAREIMSDMNLEGVELNVAVNAVIGSMVTHGYLDDLENAILVTVSNDSIKKASELRTSVVGDIEKTLEENQVQAVVYDQQVIELDEMKALAETYDISYGKAYFLKELIEQNQELTMDDMAELSSMTMEEIAQRITEKSLALGEFAEKVQETTATPATTEATEPPTTAEETTEPGTEASTAEETSAETPAETTPAETTEEEPDNVEADRVEIDYVDYEDGMIYVYFVTRVNWKNPTVMVRDDEGNSYAAMVEDTSSDECIIVAEGLESGKSYTFVLGGLTPKEGGNATTVKGYFEKPEIAGEATEPDEDDDDETDESKSESNEPDESSGPAESTESSTEATSGTEAESKEESTTPPTEPTPEESSETEKPEGSSEAGQSPASDENMTN